MLRSDALGSPRIAIDPTRGTQGTVVWRWDLAGEAFGKGYPEEDPDGDNVVFNLDLRFPGQQFDSFTGLHYNYFRDYDSGTGRYVQSDPIGLGGGVSTYAYAAGKPIAAIDPLGLLTIVIVNGNGTGHAGIWTSRGNEGGTASIYDPNGSFTNYGKGKPGSGSMLFGEDANLANYIRFQLEDGNDLTTYIFDTTEAEEVEITDAAQFAGTFNLLDCAFSTSRVLRSKERFKGLELSFSPSELKSAMDDFIKRDRPPAGRRRTLRVGE